MDLRRGAPAVTAAEIGRRDVLVAGAGAALTLAALSESTEAAPAAKNGWRFCTKCGMLFAGKGTWSVGVCPDGGAHNPAPGFDYLLLSGLSTPNPDLVRPWFQCKKCRGLFAPEGPRTGDCAKGGGHAPTGPDYGVWKGAAPAFMEAGWSGCTFCFALYWANGGDGGVCPDPFGTGKHRFGFNYKVILLR